MLNEATCSVCIIFFNPHSKPVRQTHDLSTDEASERTQESAKSRATQVPAAEAGSAGQGVASQEHTQTRLHAASFFLLPSDDCAFLPRPLLLLQISLRNGDMGS